MKEIVQYRNDMNKLNFRGFTKNDMNLFMSICAKVREQGENEVVLDFEYLRRISGYTGHTIDGFIRDLHKMSKDVLAVNCEIITNGSIDMFNLFTRFKIAKEEQKLIVKINPDFTWLLNEFTDKVKGYTIFELEEFIKLQSKYAKNLYRLLKQWRTCGEYIFYDVEEFREKMDVPKSYSNRRLMEKVITPAVRDISELDSSFADFKCEPIYAKRRGKPLTGYKFVWKSEKVSQKQKFDGILNKDNGIVTFTDTNKKKAENKFTQYEQHDYEAETGMTIDELMEAKAKRDMEQYVTESEKEEIEINNMNGISAVFELIDRFGYENTMKILNEFQQHLEKKLPQNNPE